jgi:hypothetical protein
LCRQDEEEKRKAQEVNQPTESEVQDGDEEGDDEVEEDSGGGLEGQFENCAETAEDGDESEEE